MILLICFLETIEIESFSAQSNFRIEIFSAKWCQTGPKFVQDHVPPSLDLVEVPFSVVTITKQLTIISWFHVLRCFLKHSYVLFLLMEKALACLDGYDINMFFYLNMLVFARLCSFEYLFDWYLVAQTHFLKEAVFQGIPVAPLWDFYKGQFVGVLSALDFILILREVCLEMLSCLKSKFAFIFFFFLLLNFRSFCKQMFTSLYFWSC